ncbi:MAG: 50S ribosomal protein L9 [Planctomycetaceae bacterium]|nr:50S ribosomal protein L9 [Planctomycetaceae bacterium]
MSRANLTASGRPRMHRQVELLLAEDVAAVGQQGDIIKVKPGFARNYLLPQGLATIATAENKRLVDQHRQKIAERQKQKMQQLAQLAERVGKYSVTLEANANEEGHLYGSIVAIDISKALTAAGYPVEEDHIRLDGPLKELGMYTVKLQFHQDVKSEVKVWVVPAARPAAPGAKK